MKTCNCFVFVNIVSPALEETLAVSISTPRPLNWDTTYPMGSCCREWGREVASYTRNLEGGGVGGSIYVYISGDNSLSPSTRLGECTIKSSKIICN